VTDPQLPSPAFSRRKPSDTVPANDKVWEASPLRAFDSAAAQSSVFDALVAAARKHGLKKPILEDQERNPLTYLDLIRAAFALGKKIAVFTRRSERVAVMLPSSVGGVVTFFALHAFGRVPCMLNFTAGIRNLKAACDLAGVQTVLTSHRFVEQGKLHDLIDALETKAKVVYLEDVRRTVGLTDRLFAAAAGAMPGSSAPRSRPPIPG
jgi:acyl-[acyl-carrier-protein]-phospholipid O-acyltransferase / long-chain-fatty-acid--[acyl-carrier-protein] ligase